jgi:hypothetical protein
MSGEKKARRYPELTEEELPASNSGVVDAKSARNQSRHLPFSS